MKTKHATPPEAPQGKTTVVATAFDRVFTNADLSLSEEAVRRAVELRKSGVVTVLATGRRREELPLADLRAAFDAFVLEGGAVWGPPGQWDSAPTPTAFWDAVDDLEWAGHKVELGEASFTAPVAAVADLEESPGVSFHVQRGRIEATPLGVDKWTGVEAALAGLGVADPWLLAIGRTALDVPIARNASVAVAVAGAEPEYLAAAHMRAPADGTFPWAVENIGRLAVKRVA